MMDIILIILISLAVILALISLILPIIFRKQAPVDKQNFQQLERIISEKFSKEIWELRTKNVEDLGTLASKITASSLDNYLKLTHDVHEVINNRLGLIENKMESNLKEISEYRFKLNNDTIIKLDELKQANNVGYLELSKNLIDNINNRLDNIDKKVDEKLSVGFKNSNETFMKVIEQLTKIDDAQKNMERLGQDVLSLKDILANKKSRGSYGESTLYQILYSVYGDNDQICQKQYVLPYLVKDDKGALINPIPDAVILCPAPINILCIDSKFPLENYQKTQETKASENDLKLAVSAFKNDVKKHIKDISHKYINSPTTAEIALMFLPSESIYAEINANYPDLVTEANNHHVWLTSPTTLIAVLALIQTASRNIEMNRSTQVIKEALENLAKEFGNFEKRWDKLVGHIKNLSEDTTSINITTEKIQKQFKKIENVDLYKTKEVADESNE